MDKVFLLTLLTFDENSDLDMNFIQKNQKSIRVYVTVTHPNSNKCLIEFFVKLGKDRQTDGFQLRKCIIGLTERFKDELEKQADAIYENTIIRKLPTYIKKIAQSYAGYRAEILD